MTSFVRAGAGAAILAATLAAACAIVFATRVFAGAEPARLRVVTTPIASRSGSVEVALVAPPLERVGTVAAVIARIGHDAAGPMPFSIAADGTPVCSPTIPRGGARVDCAWHRRTGAGEAPAIVVHGPESSWTLDYLEIATHHGSSSGLIQLLVLPRDSTQATPPSPWWALLVWALCAAVLRLPASPAKSRAGRVLSAVPSAAAAVLFAAILISPWVSPYRAAISVWTFAGVLAVGLAPRVWAATRVTASAARAVERALAGALAVAVAAIALGAGSRAVSASDSYGYVSQAELWLRGDLTIEQSFAADAPWPNAARTFAPLGYVTHPERPHTIVPSYPAGLPVVLAAAARLGGPSAMFWVVPLSAGVLVLAAYGLGRRLAGGGAGLAAAWLVATSPVVIAQSVVVMPDVPVAAAWTAAMFFVLGPGVRNAAAAGLCAGLAVLIRPNLAPLVGVLAGIYVLALRGADDRRASVARLLAFLVAAAPGGIAVAAINATLYGSPLSSGYGELGELFDPGRIGTNLRLYLTWFAEMHAFVPCAGLIALFAPPRLLPWSEDGRRTLPFLAACVALLWLMYSAWLVFDSWLYSRFLLPSWPLIMIGLGVIATRLARFRAIGGWAAAAVLVVGIANLNTNADYRTLTFGRNEDHYVVAAQLVRDRVPEGGIVVSLLHSGTVRHYSGRTTLNYRYLEGVWLDRAVAWLQGRGAPVYLLLDDVELPEFRERFAGNAALHALDRPPLAAVETGDARLFALAPTGAP